MVSERKKHCVFCNAYIKSAFFWEKHFSAPIVLSQNGQGSATEAEGSIYVGLMTAL